MTLGRGWQPMMMMNPLAYIFERLPFKKYIHYFQIKFPGLKKKNWVISFFLGTFPGLEITTSLDCIFRLSLVFIV